MTRLEDNATIPPPPRIGAKPSAPDRADASTVEEAGEPVEALLAALSDARSDRNARTGRAQAASGRPGSKARNLPIGTVIIERHRRGESSTEETLLEIYHAGLSVHQAEEIAATLWGPRVGLAAISDFNRKIARRIDAWRNRAIRGRHLYVFLTAVELKRNWGSDRRTVSVLVAVGVNAQGIREGLGVAAGGREDGEAWRDFLSSLQKRGLTGVKLFVSDQFPGLASSLTSLYPGAVYQQCVLQFYRSVLALVPVAQMPKVEDLLKTIHTSADRAAARARAAQIESTMRLMSLPFVAVAIAEYVEQTLGYYACPPDHWRHLRSNSLLNRIVRDIRERARVVGAFSDGPSAVHLVSARLRQIEDKSWARRRMNVILPRGLPAADTRAGAA